MKWRVEYTRPDGMTQVLGVTDAPSHARAMRCMQKRFPFLPVGALRCVNPIDGVKGNRGFQRPDVLHAALQAAQTPAAYAKRRATRDAKRAKRAGMTPSQRRWHDLKWRRERGMRRAQTHDGPAD
jgi:hypothetical protein